MAQSKEEFSAKKATVLLKVDVIRTILLMQMHKILFHVHKLLRKK